MSIGWNLVATLVYDMILVAVSAAAIRFGDVDERAGAGLMIFASGISALAYPLSVATHVPTRPIGAALNVVWLFMFDALMVRSRKFWPLWIMGFQIAAVSFDAAMLLMPIKAEPYRVLRGKFAYLQLLALLLGTLEARVRKSAAIR